MNSAPKTISQEEKDLIQDYLDNGGVIDKRLDGERSEEIEFTGGFYQKRKKKKEENQDK